MWSNIKIETYKEILELSEFDFSPTEKIIETALILDIEIGDLNDITEAEMSKITKDVKWLQTPQNYPLHIGSYGALKLGQFIDLEHYLTIGLPIFQIEKINTLLFEECSDLLITELPKLNSYIQYRTELLKSYEGLFDDPDPDPNDPIPEANDNYKWLRIVHQLSNGDITKTKEIYNQTVISVFNWLSLKPTTAGS